MAGTAGQRLRQFSKEQPAADARLYGKANQARRPAAILAAIASAWLSTRESALILLGQFDLFPLSGQPPYQLFELIHVTELDADLATAFTRRGYRDATAD